MPEYALQPTQMHRRPAARLLLTDPIGRILLFRFDHRDGALAGKSYWATPGGGLEPGESYEQAAMRELKEETGIFVTETGPLIAQREIVLQLSDGEYVLEKERYFHIAVSSDQISFDGWTACERECITEYRWWTQDELAQTHEQVSPPTLLSLLTAYGV